MTNEVAVFIPGIMGTSLHLNGKEIWPPGVRDVLTGYDDIEALQSEDVEVGTVIRNIARCYSVYQTMLDHFARLGFDKDRRDRCLVEFPYDWREDIIKTADLLKERVRTLVEDEGFDRVQIVAHSMGGLVARVMLESGPHRGESWFGRIENFTALATPHLGAPLAVVRALGLQDALGISAEDFAKLSRNSRYPAAYQLLPVRYDNAVWDMQDPLLRPVDIYTDENAERLQLEPQNLRKAEEVHAVLSKNERPDHVRYFYFAGTGQKTVTRVNAAFEADGTLDRTRTVLTTTSDGGDGTVPIYSALPHIGQRQIVTNEHASVFKGRPFARVFSKLMGVNEGAAVENDETPGAPSMRLTVSSPTNRVGDDVQFVLVAVDADGEETHISAIDGAIAIVPVSERGEPTGSNVEQRPIAYRGPKVPRLSMLVEDLPSGLWRAKFEGAPIASTEVSFAVR